MAKNSVVVGKVSVKVVPDTADFASDLRNDLRKIEKSVQRIRVGLDLDDTGLRTKLNAAIDEAERTAKSITIKVNQDSFASVQNAIADIDRQLQKIDEVDVHVALNKADLQATKAQLEELRKNTTMDLKVDFNDIESVRAASKRLGKELADLAAVDVPVKMNRFDMERMKHELDNIVDDYDGKKLEFQAAVDAAKARAELALLNRRRYTEIVVNLNKKSAAKVATALAALSGSRMIGDMVKDWGDWLSNLDKAVPKLGAVALGIAGVAGWGLSASSNLFALSSSLAQIGPAALALPGIFGGMAIGVIASAVALKDFNKYVPDFAIGLGRATKAGAAWKQLQDSMSANFWAKAAAPIKELINSLFPQVAAGMKDISTSLGTWFGGLAKGLKGALNGELAGMFKDLSDSIVIAEKGTASLTGIIATLGKVGAGYLPRLATWFVSITDRFDAFLTKAQEDGRLQSWLDVAIFNFTELGRLIGQAGGILAGLGRAAEAAGGSTISMVADTLERIHAAVDTPAFQTGMTKALQAAHEAMYAIGHISGPAIEKLFVALTDTFDKIMNSAGPAIGTLLRDIANALASAALQDGLVSLFDSLLTAVDLLTPAWQPLADIIGAVAVVVGHLAEAFAPLVTTLLQAVSPALVGLLNGLMPVVDILSVGLTNAIAALAPALGPLVDATTTLLAAIAGPIAQILPVLATAIADIAVALAPVAQSLAPMLADALGLWAGVLVQVLPMVADLATMFLESLYPILPQLTQQFSDLIDQLTPQIPLLLENAKAGLELATQLTPLAMKLVPLLTQAMSVMLPVIVFVSQALNSQLIPMLAAGAKVIENVYQKAQEAGAGFRRFGEDIGGAISSASNVLEGFRNVVDVIFRDVGSWLTNSGRSLIDGFTQGIRDRAASAKAMVSGVLSDIRKLFPFSPAKEGPFSGKGWVLYSGMSIADAMADGIQARANNAVQAARQMAEETHAALSGAESSSLLIRQNNLTYYAAQNNSLSAEEDLFAAADRGRMVGF
ncbi:hypothetical protein [Cellulomonas sp. SG140]|uniref:hypothetical protein n=1 Tax=Cellulomonas sp. SG140 TaxID=2976536 RepID=UPI0021E862C0|nr:hypothetical protein [Cellulomonas sp. SG140]